MTNELRPEEVVGRRVKQLRIEAGWSQETLADRMRRREMPWRQTTVAKTEAADRPLRVDELVELSNVFGVAIDQLTSDGDMTAGEQRLRDRLLVARQEFYDAQRQVQTLTTSLQEAQRRLEDADQRSRRLQEQLATVRERKAHRGKH